MNNIDKLIFFSEKGYEIPVQKKYTLEWEIIPNDIVRNNFIDIPRGHIVLNDLTSKQFNVVIDNPGKILLYPVQIPGNDDVKTIPEICLLNKSYTYTTKSKFGINSKEVNIYNKVKFTFNTLDDSVEYEVPADVFKSLSSNEIVNKNVDGVETTYYIIT